MYDDVALKMKNSAETRDEYIVAQAANAAMELSLPEFEFIAGLSVSALALLRNPAKFKIFDLNQSDRGVLAEAFIQLLVADGTVGSQNNVSKYKAAHAEEAKVIFNLTLNIKF